MTSPESPENSCEKIRESFVLQNTTKIPLTIAEKNVARVLRFKSEEKVPKSAENCCEKFRESFVLQNLEKCLHSRNTPARPATPQPPPNKQPPKNKQQDKALPVLEVFSLGSMDYDVMFPPAPTPFPLPSKPRTFGPLSVPRMGAGRG